MKKKSILLAFVLCLTSLFGLFGLTACGEVSVGTVKASLDSLVQTYTRYAEFITLSGTSESDNWNLEVHLGSNIVSRASGREKYTSLTETYPNILKISNNYVMQNKEYIEELKDGNLSSGAKDRLKTLNSNINAYTSEIKSFISNMNSFDGYLKGLQEQETANPEPEEGVKKQREEEEQLYLRRFKKSYGSLVSKNISMATSVANFVEATGVFNLIKDNVSATDQTFKLIKGYIRIKLLPAFSRYKIDRIENVFDFKSEESAHGDAYSRVNKQLKRLDELFETYEEKLVPNTIGNVGGNESEKKNNLNYLFDYADNFFKHQNNYLKAVNGINFHDLSQSGDAGYDSAKYQAKNRYFLTYMDTIDTFLGVDGVVNAPQIGGEKGELAEFMHQVCALLGI